MFRPVSMVVPDSTVIAEIILLGEGFSNCKVLKHKETIYIYMLKGKWYRYRYREENSASKVSLSLCAGVKTSCILSWKQYTFGATGDTRSSSYKCTACLIQVQLCFCFCLLLCHKLASARKVEDYVLFVCNTISAFDSTFSSHVQCLLHKYPSCGSIFVVSVMSPI